MQLEVLRLLTPRQLAELLVLTGPSLQDKEQILHMIFDHLTEAPNKTDIQVFLISLVEFLKMVQGTSCLKKTEICEIDEWLRL